MRKNYIFLLLFSIMMYLPVAFSQNHLEEGFENTAVGAIPDGWEQVCTGTSKWEVEKKNGDNLRYPTTVKSGTGRIKFATNGTSQSGMLITPPRNITVFDEPILTFSYASVPFPDGTADSLIVHYRYSPTSQWQSVPLGRFGATENDDWVTITFDIPPVASQIQFGFEAVDHSGHGIVLDDIHLTQRATCQIPASVEVYNIIHNHAKVKWDGLLTSKYTVKLSDTPIDPETQNGIADETIAGGKTNYEWNNLTPNTTYYYYIQADCNYGNISPWAEGSFTAACPPVSSLVTSFEEEDALDCWTKNVVTDNYIYKHLEHPLPDNRPYSMITYEGYNFLTGEYYTRSDDFTPIPYEGNYSLMLTPILKNYTDDYTIISVVSPRLEDEIGQNLDKMQLDFLVRSNSSPIKLRVKVAEWPDALGDAETEAAGVLSLRTNNVYEKITITFEDIKNLDKSHYIVFYIDGSETTLPGNFPRPQIDIDFLELKTIETCSQDARVGMFSEPVIKGTTAELKWNPSGASKWNLKVSTFSMNPVNETGIIDTIVKSPEILLENLMPGTQYYYYVQPACEDGTRGIWSNQNSFTTECSTTGTPIPYKENFDKGLPLCWSYLHNVPYLSGRAYSSPNALILRGFGYFITPEIEGDLSMMQVRFKVISDQIIVPLVIGVMENPLDDSTFRPLKSHYVDEMYTTSGYYPYEEVTVLLNEATEKEKYVAFKYDTGDYKEFIIDDFVLETISGCAANPENIKVTETSANTITLDWTPVGEESNWDVLYGKKGFILSDELDYDPVETPPPYTISGLKENMDYDIYLRSSCINDAKGIWHGPITTRTMLPAEVPYECDFEDPSENAAWIVPNGNMINNWAIGNVVYYEGENSLYISDFMGANNRFSPIGTFVYAYRTFDLEVGYHEFEFMWKSQNINSQHLAVFLVPDDVKIEGGKSYGMHTSVSVTNISVPEGWIAFTKTPLHSSTDDWEKFEYSHQLRESGKYNLVFCWKTSANVDISPASAIDNVKVIRNDSYCPTPESLVISEVKQTSAKLEFFSLNAEQWKLIVSEVKLEDEDLDGVTTFTEGVIFAQPISSNPYPITDLNADQDYYVYIKSDCEKSGDWASTSFTTTCEAVGLPYEEDFNTLPDGDYPDCWWQMYNVTAKVDKGNFNFDGRPSGVILPEFEADINTLQATFKLMSIYDYSVRPIVLEVGVVTDPSDPDSFELVEVVYPQTASQWSTFIVLFNEYIHEEGKSKHIAFRAPGLSNYFTEIYMDDLKIEVIEGCASPREISIDKVTSTGVEFSWRVIDESLPYRVKVCSSPQTRWEDEGDYYDKKVSGNSVKVSDLFPATNYYIYVRTDCEDGSYSTTYSNAEFMTECGDAIALPYFEDFESYEVNDEPNCWIMIDNPPARGEGIKIDANGIFDIVTEINIKPIGKQKLTLTASSLNNGLVALPEFEEDIENLKLSFKAVQSSNSSLLSVGLMSDLTDINSFTLVKSINLPDVYKQWYDVEVTFEGHKESGSHIALLMKKENLAGFFYIDNLSVKNKNKTCPDVSNMVVSKITDNSAAISWFYEEDVTFDIKVSTKRINPEVDEGNHLPTTNKNVPFHNLTNLDPSTTYFVYVRNKCTGNQDGYWEGPLVFTTSCAGPFTMPFAENFDEYGEIENYGFFPPCWRQRMQINGELSKSSQSAPYIEADELFLMMKAGYDNDGSYAVLDAISPKLEFDDDKNVSDYQMTFKLRSDLVVDGKLYISLYPDASDVTVLTVYDTIYVNKANEWTNQLVNFRYHAGEEQHIGFRINSLDAGQAYSVQIDSIYIQELFDCMPPYKVRVDSRPTKAFLSWLPGDEDNLEWKYYYSENEMTIPFTDEEFEQANQSNGTTPFHGSGTVTEPRVTLNGLTAASLYIYIKNTDCDRFYPAELVYIQPVCTTIEELPFVESFTTHGFGADEPEYSAFPDCWTREDNNNHGIKYPYIDNDAALYFYSVANEATVASLPATSLNISKLQIRFSAMSENDGSLQIGIRSNSDLGTDYQTYTTITPPSEYTEYTIEFDKYEIPEGEDNRYYVVLTSESAQENTVKIKDFVLEEKPYCHTPIVVLEEVTQTSFRVSWITDEDENPTRFQVAIGLKGSDPETLNIDEVRNIKEYSSDKNLTLNTQYEFFLRTFCSNGLTSSWSRFPVTTLQEPAVYPYETDFIASEAANWTLLNGYAENQWVTGAAAGKANSLYISNDKGQTHEYTVTERASVYAYRTVNIPAGPHILSFDWKAGGETNKDFLRVFLVPQSITFTAGNAKDIDIAYNSTPEGWVDLSGELSGQGDWTSAELDIYISHLNKEPMNIVFYWVNNDDSGDGKPAAIANLKLSKSEVCTNPEYLSAHLITSKTADLNWISYNAKKWNIKLFNQPQLNPETASGGTTFVAENDPPYQVKNLSSDTEYYFYVQSDCDVTQWSEVGYFRTLCDPQTDVLLEEFNQVPPSCWRLYEGLASEIFADPLKLTTTTEGWVAAPIDALIFESPSAKLNIKGTNTAHWLVSPSVHLTKNSALSFDLALTAVDILAPIYSPQGQADDQFMVLITKDDGLTWSAADATVWNNKEDGDFSFNKIATEGERIDIDLFGYTNETIRVAFYGESTIELESNDIHIDNVEIACRFKESFTGSVCEGYSYNENGFNITREMNAKAGQYTYSRIEPSKTGGCDTTMVLNLTVRPIIYNEIYDTICSNHPYSDENFTNLDKTDVYTSKKRFEAENGCDSLVRLYLQVYPAFEEKVVLELSSNDLPRDFECKRFEEGQKSGYFKFKCYTKHGCDSIIDLTLVIDGVWPTSLDEAEYDNLLTFIPNPSRSGEFINVNYEFTAAEREGMTLEVFNSSGMKISSEMPTTYPVSVKAPAASGIYMIQIKTGTQKVLHGKIIVN